MLTDRQCQEVLFLFSNRSFLIGLQIDLTWEKKYSKVLLDRTDKIDTPTDMSGTADWNTIARNLNVMFSRKGNKRFSRKVE